MENQLKNVLSKVISDNELKQKLESLESKTAVYSFLKEEGYTGSKNDFEKGLKKLAGDYMKSNEITEAELTSVAGGIGNKGKLSKATATALSLLTLAGTAMPGAGAFNVKDLKVEAKNIGTKIKNGLKTKDGKLIALAAAAVTTGGAAIVGASTAIAVIFGVKYWRAKNDKSEIVEVRDEDKAVSTLGFRLTQVVNTLIKEAQTKEQSDISKVKVDSKILDNAINAIMEDSALSASCADEIEALKKLKNDGNATLEDFSRITIKVIEKTKFKDIKDKDGKEIFNKKIFSRIDNRDEVKFDDIVKAVKNISKKSVKDETVEKSSNSVEEDKKIFEGALSKFENNELSWRTALNSLDPKKVSREEIANIIRNAKYSDLSEEEKKVFDNYFNEWIKIQDEKKDIEDTKNDNDQWRNDYDVRGLRTAELSLKAAERDRKSVV